MLKWRATESLTEKMARKTMELFTGVRPAAKEPVSPWYREEKS